MKKILLIASLVAVYTTQAQNIKLEAGKKITVVTTNNMDMDMSIAGSMKSEASATSVINVVSVDGDKYNITCTNTKLKSSQDAMGQSMNFDSDKKEDLDSEIGKELGKNVNKAIELILNKNNGVVVSKNKNDEEDGNPMKEVMASAGGNSAESIVSNTFFVIPAGKKVGDSWVDSSSEAGMKRIKTIQYKSLNADVATLNVSTVVKGTMSKETQGMQMEITINGTTDAAIEVNTTNSIVKKNTSKGEVNGSIDVMGQSVPITMKINNTTITE